MNFDITQINKRETIKLWAILNGKYDEYVRAYSTEDNNLRRYWETMIEPEVQRECCEPYMQLKMVNGSHSMWVPSVNDCLSNDWAIAK